MCSESDENHVTEGPETLEVERDTKAGYSIDRHRWPDLIFIIFIVRFPRSGFLVAGQLMLIIVPLLTGPNAHVIKLGAVGQRLVSQ